MKFIWRSLLKKNYPVGYRKHRVYFLFADKYIRDFSCYFSLELI